LLFVGIVLYGLSVSSPCVEGGAYDTLLRWVRNAQAVWQAAGMRYKVKTFVGFYQCIAAVPSVYDVKAPPGLEEYTRWLSVFELPAELENVIVPTACLGDYHSRIWLGSSWALALVLLVATGCVAWEVVQVRRSSNPTARRLRKVVSNGLCRTLPFMLGLTFCVVPSTSTRLFRTFMCEPIQFSAGETRRYLSADPALACDTAQYDATRTTAFLFVVVWPVGIPLMYTSLLWVRRKAYLKDIPTRLSCATEFLTGDYKRQAFLWEPLEMCRKLLLTGWVLMINDEAEQARVLAALLISFLFLVVRLSLKPNRRRDDTALAISSELALVLVYMCALVIKACEVSSAACSPYGFGADSTGVFLFFIFFGLSVLGLTLFLEVALLVHVSRRQEKLCRLRYRGGHFVKLSPVIGKEFVHLPGLEISPCFHLFLSHAWPLGQDVCKLIKQRCREICPSLRVFLDVEDLASGSGTNEVDHSRCILVFAMPVYFEKVNCVKELTRSIVRDKLITLLLPDSEVHGTFTQDMITDIVTDGWVKSWKLEVKLAEWAKDWGVAEIKTPTASEICAALFQQPPLEWSRITPFQDRTMVLMCERLLPKGDNRGIYLQGATSFELPKQHAAVTVFCSRHNLGAAELAKELNNRFSIHKMQKSASSFSSSSTNLRSHGSSSTNLRDLGRGAATGQLLEVADRFHLLCEFMLVYLNANTWSHAPEQLANDIREAMANGAKLQLCHEFPSAIDPQSARAALPFKDLMDMTPSDLKKNPNNIYSEIAVALKGGALRDVGLANVAKKLAAPRKLIKPLPENDWRRPSYLRAAIEKKAFFVRNMSSQMSESRRDSKV